jgi:hypothetical protein
MSAFGNESNEGQKMPDENMTEQTALVAHSRAIEMAAQQAVAEALRNHKLLGNPVCAWRDGHVVWIPPEEICIPGENGADGGQ